MIGIQIQIGGRPQIFNL